MTWYSAAAVRKMLTTREGLGLLLLLTLSAIASYSFVSYRYGEVREQQAIGLIERALPAISSLRAIPTISELATPKLRATDLEKRIATMSVVLGGYRRLEGKPRCRVSEGRALCDAHAKFVRRYAQVKMRLLLVGNQWTIEQFVVDPK